MWSRLQRAWVVATLVVLSALAQGRTPGDRPQITVLVYNDASIELATLLAAEKTAGRIYKKAGVDMVWMNCLSPAETEVERCNPARDPRQFVLSIEHQSRADTADVYGVAFLGNDGRGQSCDVFYDRTLEVSRAEPADEATILGIVMAHELGHLLLGLNAHTAAGVMRAQWHFKDFLLGLLGTGFTREEIQTIGDRLAEVAPVQRASQ
jgi:hypothetical protein